MNLKPSVLIAAAVFASSTHAMDLQYYSCKGESLGVTGPDRKVQTTLIVWEDQVSITDSHGVQLTLPRLKRRGRGRVKVVNYEMKDEFTESRAKVILPLKAADASRFHRKSFQLIYEVEYRNYLGDFEVAVVKSTCRAQ